MQATFDRRAGLKLMLGAGAGLLAPPLASLTARAEGSRASSSLDPFMRPDVRGPASRRPGREGVARCTDFRYRGRM